MRTKSVSMQTIASKLGVSKMTVSRVLAGKGYFNKELAKKIKLAAFETGYFKRDSHTPILSDFEVLGNLQNKGIASKKNRVLAISDTWDFSVHSRLLSDLETALLHREFELYACALSSDIEEAKSLESFSAYNDFHSILALSQSGKTSGVLKAFSANGGKCAAIAGTALTDMCASFCFDNSDALGHIVKILKDRNYAKPVFMALKGENNMPTQKMSAKLASGAGLELFGDIRVSNIEETRGAMEKYFEGLTRADAIICSNKNLAIAAREYLESSRIRVPENAGVACLEPCAELDITSPEADVSNLAAEIAEYFSDDTRKKIADVKIVRNIAEGESTKKPEKSLVWVL